ncbi:MAG TPA: sensor histidine kinase N-terminal domain-containing protein [Luteibacter sp.]|jgi:two-component system sensor histidine kinase TctE|nr:sensor histidine kinase N-terminal domain-containing protein [Luteibacter sp.]
MTSAVSRPRQLSLRRRLLIILLVPVLVVLLLDALLEYGLATEYSNRVHDRDLSDTALTLAEMMSNDSLGGTLSAQASFLLEYDPEGRNYYTVDSKLHGHLIGNADLQPTTAPLVIGHAPVLYDTERGRRPLRAASLVIPSANDPTDILTVTVAETLRDRHQRAREILLISVPLQTLLIVVVLALVWFGVKIGLRVLDPLTARLARREHDLGPIGETDVPTEILPLTRTIDALFARMRGVIGLQERFIADAAHQLRTPLAGMLMQVERLQADDDRQARDEAIAHIRRLAERAARTSKQLLALTRAQSPTHEVLPLPAVDLAQLIPEAVSQRVPQALASGIDLGYEGDAHALFVRGDPLLLQEMLDNLIDNAFRYGGDGCTVTVAVREGRDDTVLLCVEDDGPGVPEAFIDRLGERFFRVPGVGEGGTGLGLAIVESIADQHDAKVVFGHGPGGGLRVELRFPRSTVTDPKGS